MDSQSGKIFQRPVVHGQAPNISLHPTVLSPLRAAKTAAELHR